MNVIPTVLVVGAMLAMPYVQRGVAWIEKRYDLVDEKTSFHDAIARERP